MTTLLTLLILVAILILALGLAWAPMQILLAQMAKNVTAFVHRQRERRNVRRDTPDRRTLG